MTIKIIVIIIIGIWAVNRTSKCPVELDVESKFEIMTRTRFECVHAVNQKHRVRPTTTVIIFYFIKVDAIIISIKGVFFRSVIWISLCNIGAIHANSLKKKL